MLEKSKRNRHKLAADVPFYDVRPPRGVRSAMLHVAQLDICIKRKSRRKRPKLENYESFPVSLNSTSEDQSVATTILRSSEGHYSDLDVHEKSGIRSTSCCNLCGAAFESILGPGDIEDDCEYEDMLLQVNNEGIPTIPRQAPQTPSLLKRTSSAMDITTGKDVCITDAIVTLVDAAIRAAISDSSTRFAGDIEVTESESFRRLGAIAPALCSPGYLPAISSRAVLLPTIRHALENLSYTHAKKGSPKRKAHELADQSRYQSRDGGLTWNIMQRDQHKPLALSNDLDTQLWRTLQNGVYDSKATRRLEPITTSVRGSATDTGSQVELLEPSHAMHANKSLEDSEMFVEFEFEFEEHESLPDEDLFDLEFDSAYASMCEQDDRCNIVLADDIDILGTESVRLGGDIDIDNLESLPWSDGNPVQVRDRTRRVGQDSKRDTVPICGSVSSMHLPREEGESDGTRSLLEQARS